MNLPTRTLYGLVLALTVFPLPAQADADRAPSNPAFTVERLVAARRADVWNAFTTSEGLRTFFSPHARIELRLGGAFEILFVPDAEPGMRGSEGCEVLSFLEEEMLSFSWNAPQSFGPLRGQHTFVVVRLRDAAGADGAPATTVELTHGGWQDGEDWAAVRTYFQQAWPSVLNNLAKRFEEGPLFSDEQVRRDLVQARETFAIFLSPTSTRAVMQPNEAQRAAFAGHVEHIRKLESAALLIVAGPCPGDPIEPTRKDCAALAMPTWPGIVLIRAVDAAHAKEIMERDPAVRAGIFKTTLLPFKLAFGG